MRARKLLPEDVLVEAVSRSNMGVPHTRIKKDLGVELSLPKFNELLKWYKYTQKVPHSGNGNTQETVWLSLFPSWIKQTQIQPDDWKYRGTFPFGEWYRQ